MNACNQLTYACCCYTCLLSGPCLGPLEAQQAAALAALHLLQALDSAALNGTALTPPARPISSTATDPVPAAGTPGAAGTAPAAAAVRLAAEASAGVAAEASAMDVDVAAVGAGDAAAAAAAGGSGSGGDNMGGAAFAAGATTAAVETLWEGQGHGLLRPKPGMVAKVSLGETFKQCKAHGASYTAVQLHMLLSPSDSSTGSAQWQFEAR